MSPRKLVRRTVLGPDLARHRRTAVAAAGLGLGAFGLVRGAVTVRALSDVAQTGNPWLGIVFAMTIPTLVGAPLFSAAVAGVAGAFAHRTRSLAASCLAAFGVILGASWGLFEAPLFLLRHPQFLVDVLWFSATLAAVLGPVGFLVAAGVRSFAGEFDGRR